MRWLVHLAALEEEGTLLGDEELEAREVDDLHVGLDEGEVRIHGDVDGHRARGAPAGVSADLEVGLLALLRGGQTVGDQLPGLLLARPELQAGERAEAGDPERVFRRSRPERDLESPRDRPHQAEAPGAVFPGLEPQDREGDLELDSPPVPVAPGGARPGLVPDLVRGAPVVGDARVPLCRERVGGEAVRRASVEERVQDHPHRVVVAHVSVTTGHRCRQPIRLRVVALEGHVERGARLADADHRPEGRRLAELGLDLDEW